MFGFRKFIDKINIVPKASSSAASQGDLEVSSVTGTLDYHDGTTVSSVLTADHAATLTNKSIDADTNTITNIENADIKAGAAIDATKLADGSVTNTELQYINSVTSNVQTQLDGKEPTITVLPISKGGTNSGTALNNNRIMVSSTGAIVEAAALTNGQLLIGSTGAAPVAAAITAGTGISVTNGAGSITINATSTAPAGDINETSFSAADGQASPANVTGLAFNQAVTRSFRAQVSVTIDATTPLFETFDLTGINTDTDFMMAIDSVGDNSLINFTITSTGQVQYTSATFPGFVSATVKFRAMTLTV